MSKDKTNANTNRSNADVVSNTSNSAPAVQDTGKTVSYHNSMSLNWPTDIWGFTSELRTALKHAASKVGGHPDKKALLDATLALGIKHIEDKYAENNKALKARYEAAQSKAV